MLLDSPVFVDYLSKFINLSINTHFFINRNAFLPKELLPKYLIGVVTSYSYFLGTGSAQHCRDSGVCYELFDSAKKTWNDAKTVCEAMPGNMRVFDHGK